MIVFKAQWTPIFIKMQSQFFFNRELLGFKMRSGIHLVFLSWEDQPFPTPCDSKTVLIMGTHTSSTGVPT